jgi:peptide/nickel transport system substrate-binding protein
VANVDDDSVSRIDPKTNVSVQTVPVGSGPAGVAVGGGFAWVANGLDGTVSRIDQRDRVVQEIPVGSQPAAVAFGEGSVWVANSGDRTVMRIDARTGRVRSTVRLDTGAVGIAVGAGAVWVTSESAGTVARIDSRAGRVVRTVNVGGGASAVAFGAGSVWVANRLDGTVWRIDPASNRVKGVITVGDGPSGIAIAPDGKVVWVSNELAGTLSRIDTAQDKVVQTVTTGNRPEGVALIADRMYVAVRSSGLAHRGGTLIALTSGPFASIDPAVSYDTTAWQTLILTNDGLVAYRRVGGSAGVRLVPDLATSLPTLTDGHTRYTFQLRRGVRYSTGALVRPTDFRRAIERALADPEGPGRIFFGGIVGAATCLKIPKHCDLKKGIEADPVANTVSFHLTAPDPDLLYKLALPTAFAVPASTPLKAQLPLPATGPYIVASYNRQTRLRLVRNPRFREWSETAQPDGYPDEIVWRVVGLSPEAQFRVVERGTADLASLAIGPLSPALLSALRARYAPQLHLNAELSTGYFFLNTRLPPFDDVRVRRAVNYAVDRNRGVEIAGGPDLTQASCQVLPPNLDGYSRYCPYTTHPRSDGKYSGPDLAKERQLVEASGTKGQAVTVTIAQGFEPQARNIVSALRAIGYNARLKVVTGGFDAYQATEADSRRKTQTAGDGWAADYPSAASFFAPNFTCRSFLPRSPANGNRAEFCNLRIDAEISRARALQTSNPHAAAQLWSTIDHDITDQAPWVFLGNRRKVDFVSRRVGNYQYNPQWGALIDQMWVR